MKIVRRNAWHVCKLLASSAPPGKVKGVCPECWPVVASSHCFAVEWVCFAELARKFVFPMVHYSVSRAYGTPCFGSTPSKGWVCSKIVFLVLWVPLLGLWGECV